jgi:hypothetical protein
MQGELVSCAFLFCGLVVDDSNNNKIRNFEMFLHQDTFALSEIRLTPMPAAWQSIICSFRDIFLKAHSGYRLFLISFSLLASGFAA